MWITDALVSCFEWKRINLSIEFPVDVNVLLQITVDVWTGNIKVHIWCLLYTSLEFSGIDN